MCVPFIQRSSTWWKPNWLKMFQHYVWPITGSPLSYAETEMSPQKPGLRGKQEFTREQWSRDISSHSRESRFHRISPGKGLIQQIRGYINNPRLGSESQSRAVTICYLNACFLTKKIMRYAKKQEKKISSTQENYQSVGAISEQCRWWTYQTKTPKHILCICSKDEKKLCYRLKRK